MVLPNIPPIDKAVVAAATARNSILTKPPSSLGRLEDIAIRLAGIQGTVKPSLDRAAVVVAAGNHGVTTEGVSAYPSDVTAQMVANFEGGGAAINAIAQSVGAKLHFIDAGVSPGTQNFAKSLAMTAAGAEAVIARGCEFALGLNVDVICLGEMGIGNTTAAAGVAAVALRRSPGDTVGRGTMVDDTGLQRKIEVIHSAIELHRPDPTDAMSLLSAFGGYETGFLCGCILGAASRRITVVLDGFPCTAAALLADLLSPQAREFMIAGHRSIEPGHRLALDHLELTPVLDLEMRLGEGSGATLALPILRAAAAFLSEMASFQEASVDNRIS